MNTTEQQPDDGSPGGFRQFRQVTPPPPPPSQFNSNLRPQEIAVPARTAVPVPASNLTIVNTAEELFEAVGQGMS